MDNLVGRYCQSHAHNVVLFDGHEQSFEDLGEIETSRVVYLIDLGGLGCVQVDITGPMSVSIAQLQAPALVR